MKGQLALPLQHPVRTLELRPVSAPLFVRELVVLRTLAPGEDQVVRRMTLRPGLNVLWARSEEGEDEGDVRAGLSGHAAGKTTFCRLLRYALGEPHFGDDTLRRALRAALPEAWLLAEVHVRGQVFAVCRPLGIGPHPFVVRGGLSGVFDAEAEREELAVYLQALDGLVCDENGGPLPLPSSGAPLRFGHLLQWLARDQECRLADLLAWRDPSSESGAPQLDTAERQFLVRAILGLLSAQEGRELATYEDLLAQRRIVDLIRKHLDERR